MFQLSDSGYLDFWMLSERGIYILNFGHLESAERNLEDLGNLTNFDEIFTNSRYLRPSTSYVMKA